MRKILTIAWREYQAMVATRAFMIGMAMMPVLMLGGAWLPGLLQGMEKSEDRRIAVIDRTGRLFQPLKFAAEQRTRLLKAEENSKDETSGKRSGEVIPVSLVLNDAESSETAAGGVSAFQPGMSQRTPEERKAREALGLEEIHRYVLEEVSADTFGDEERLALSEKIRNGELYAFVEIPEEILDAELLDLSAIKSPEQLQLPTVTWIAEDAALSDAKRWADMSLNQIIRIQRLASTVSPVVLPTVMLELERKAIVQGSGLYFRDESGRITSEEKPNEFASLMLPVGIMMLMFMVIMMSAQPMLESVLEEKTLRIAEVLLGAANANQLMTGKLIGNVAGSLTVFGVYSMGGIIAAIFNGYSDSIPYHILPWFIVYQLLAVLLFSSVFMAIAASVSQLREAQSLLMPVWMVIMLPLFVWFNVVREPNSTLATVMSFFPPSTPMMMTLRMATGATIPVWQTVASFVIMIAGTTVGILAAARIYRVGILRQGKTPRLTEILGWLFHRDGSRAN
jgi:ABC-2 type transport system permease protein